MGSTRWFVMVAEFISEVRPLKLPAFSGLAAECCFSRDVYRPELFAQLKTEMPEAIVRSAAKRQASFLAGRFLANQLQRKLLGTAQAIGIGTGREPLWPSGMVGSISHTQSQVVCALACGDARRDAIGIDIESLLAPQAQASARELVVNNAELKLLEHCRFDQRLGLTLLFSAKESLFKALYPQVRAYFDFLEVECIAINKNTLVIKLLRSLTEELAEGRMFSAYYRIEFGRILTFVQAVQPVDGLLSHKK